MEFFKQIKKPEVQTHFEKKVKERNCAQLKAEWASLSARLGSAQHVLIDVRGVENILGFASFWGGLHRRGTT
jgi:hypothetical protein